MEFTNDIDENCEVIKELLRDLPPEPKSRAKYAAMSIEATWETLRRQHPRDPAIALGAAFAVYTIAQRMVAQDKEAVASGGGLIQLMS